ncbi:hypothetical protein AYO50_01820 [Acidobacteria bacterium SCGC AG-212-P17]|nr:hypothetical protein AYO50_01820 [Acidobacteria bacterium SCGC AG-212-P17]
MALGIYVVTTIRGDHQTIQKNSLAGDKAVNNYIPRGEFRDTNTSAVLAVYRILRRQPWKTMAITTWDHMRRFLHLALIATSLGALLPTLAQARLYDVVSSNVPFTFQIGERTFKPGHYDFILAAPGVVAMRDSHSRVVANIATRPRTPGALATATKLVFNTHSKTAQLIQIWATVGEPGMDVVGEEKTVRTVQPASPVNTWAPGFDFLMQRPASPGLKH